MAAVNYKKSEPPLSIVYTCRFCVFIFIVLCNYGMCFSIENIMLQSKNTLQ